jgi:D-cysteine desulfhydrase
VRLCQELSRTGAELWVKDDGRSHPWYGGSKVRKAGPLLAEAVKRGARRVLSFGAAGSHHLLTLTLFARAAGLECAGIVFPQPHTEHALETLRVSLAQGLRPYVAAHPALIPWVFARAFEPGDYVVGPGGSNAIGTRACSAAIDELAEQVAAGALPVPDVIVVPLGSGGTCAGLAAGVVRRNWQTRVLGVQVAGGPGPRVVARWLARAALREAGFMHRNAALDACLRFDATQVGRAYGARTEAGERATRVARECGLELDPTYTAKAFASVLDLLQNEGPTRGEGDERPFRVLYWHTLSASLGPELQTAPSPGELSPALRRLLTG